MKKLLFIIPLFAVAAVVLFSRRMPEHGGLPSGPAPVVPSAARQMVAAARQQPDYTVLYDPAYVTLDYPGGDVPRDRGVCTDVVVRAFRAAGVDLQKEVHEDMQQHFSVYPDLWGLTRPDPNIDHRRVPNLMTFFERRGVAVAVTNSAESYLPGDVVAWRLDNGRLHVGVVTDSVAADRSAYLIVHNIGSGAQLENVLFDWEIIGHYRYFRGTHTEAQ